MYLFKRLIQSRPKIQLEPFSVLKITNLPNEITVDELADVFHDYGRVQNCSRDFLKNGEYLASGIVKMDKKGALLAMEGLKKSPVMGYYLEVQEMQIEKREPWIKQQYEQMDTAPTNRAQWTAQAKRWDLKRKAKS